MELFGDPVKSPKHSLSPIGTIGEVMTGTTPSMKKYEYYDSKDIMFIKQRCTRGYKRYKETSGLIERKECQIFHSIFT